MPALNSDWLHDAKWGVFTHWGGGGDRGAWNARVDAFDVDLLAAQLVDLGARYYFITLGQCSGHYCAPNDTYDGLVGDDVSLCSRRDLISDIADALAPHRIALGVYAAANGPVHYPPAAKKLDLILDVTLGWGIEGNRPHEGQRLVAFQRKFEAVLRDWSLRWGPKVRAWWLDACCYYLHCPPADGLPSFRTLADALKAGNADALVAFNSGVNHPVVTVSEYEDFTAGEMAEYLPLGVRQLDGRLQPLQRHLGSAQWHVLNFIGEHWGGGRARFPTELVVGYTKYVNSHGGVVTWDVGIDDVGNLQADHLEQLKALAASIH